MKKEDTLQKGPSTLLLREQDLGEYRDHRARLHSMEPVNSIGDGSHIRPINKSGTIFNEKQRRHTIAHENRILFDKIGEILQRKTFTTKHGRNFTRPQFSNRQQEMYSSQRNHELVQTQTRIRINQRQSGYKQIMRENRRFLQQLVASGPSVPTLENELSKFEKQVGKVQALRTINHPSKQCFDRGYDSAHNKTSRLSKMDLTATATRLKLKEIESQDHEKPMLRSQIMKGLLHNASNSTDSKNQTSDVFPKIRKRLSLDPDTISNPKMTQTTFGQGAKTDRVNPFSTRSQSIGFEGVVRQIGVEGVKLKKKKK